ncbi:MAG TPA: SDR family NAD(P)-dependent oxidoreductase [Acidimicrobiales bacterium]|jgi:NAD(P)-dependent dehydrogenase (short-subunit alcohol dehydrogenase family)|nr:SDR family NAD(P)-dependent oxidoreductase [Acidimicrobiales bacterium]
MSQSEPRFQGRVALVTGAAGAGIGAAVARRLAREGAAIIAVDHHAARTVAIVEELRAAHDVPVLGFPVDVTDRAAVDAVLDAATRELGTIDILVNNAAINVQGSVFDYDPDDFERVVAVDLTACWYLIRRLIGPMRELGHGSIVNISSVAAYNGGRGREAPYSAAKAGLLEITRSVAIEAGPHGIRCNAIAPGLVMSKFVEKHRERFQADADATPLRRHGRADEIANVVAFLVSDESSYITGEVINVSGGWFLSP